MGEMKKQKSKRFSNLIRRGKPLRWTMDIIVPNGAGRSRNDGRPNARTQFVLDYMSRLFEALDVVLADVGGMSRVYQVSDETTDKIG